MLKELINLLKITGQPFNSSIGGVVRNITVFSGERIPRTGFYGIVKHEKDCEKLLPAERKMFYCKGSIAHTPIVCQHDVLWKLLGEV